MGDWILRLLKGALIGTGFILPGVSGGALAAIFGLYERIIGFIAHITRNFFANVLFFLPVGIGALAGIVAVSHPLAFLLENYEAQVLWGFIGCIAGTLPALWKDAGKHGRKGRHIVILLLTAILGFCLLFAAKEYLNGFQTPLNFFTWLFAGIIIALGVLVPGMSPSNFLVYLGMYKPMVEAIKTLDFLVLLPVIAGFGACLFSLSAVFDALFKKAYAALFHFVIGIVIASTLMIVPLNFNYANLLNIVVCAAAILVGFALGFWMSKLETKYKAN